MSSMLSAPAIGGSRLKVTLQQTERLDRAMERAESKGVKIVVKERP
jgi:hypothetical protein